MMSTSTPAETPEQIGDTDDAPLVVLIVEAIADAKGLDPMAESIELTQYIDPDILETLETHAAGDNDTDWSFQFTVDEHTVTVQSTGQITVS